MGPKGVGGEKYHLDTDRGVSPGNKAADTAVKGRETRKSGRPKEAGVSHSRWAMEELRE